MNIIWASIAHYEGLYQVCSAGSVLSVPRPRTHGGLLRQGLSEGYPMVSLSRGGVTKSYKVHQLVLEAFDGPCPPGHECRHLDGNKLNNSWPDNLVWGTPRDNGLDRTEHGTNPSSRITDEQVLAAFDSWELGEPVPVLAAGLGVTDTAIRSRMQQLDAARYGRLAVGAKKISDDAILVFYQRWQAGESKRSLAAEAGVDRHALTYRFAKIQEG